MSITNNIVWKPHPGSQELFLSCPFFECLYDGTRGPGKTDALLMDFAQHVGQGWGEDMKGVIFRKTYKQLSDIILKSLKWFKRIFPDAKYNGSEYTWTFKTGERLFLRYLRRPEDYYEYHGHSFCFVAFEELTGWATSDCYDLMKSCCRSDRPGIPKKYRATCNSYGVGHNWVKAYFIDPAPAGVPVPTSKGRHKVRIFGRLKENLTLMKADPFYIDELRNIQDENKRKAWLEGSWDIIAGGAFSDLWQADVHIIRRFEIPRTWSVFRSFDWGSSRPFSVGWWGVSDGRMFPAGTMVRLHEWYGCTEKANTGLNMSNAEIGRKINEISDERFGKNRVQPGPADPSIFTESGGKSIAEQMDIPWERGNNRPGSRIAGVELFREMLLTSADTDKILPDKVPAFFVTEDCRDFIRLIPNMPRSEKNPDDVDTDSEDHIWDETRYAILWGRREVSYGGLMP